MLQYNQCIKGGPILERYRLTAALSLLAIPTWATNDSMLDATTPVSVALRALAQETSEERTASGHQTTDRPLHPAGDADTHGSSAVPCGRCVSSCLCCRRSPEIRTGADPDTKASIPASAVQQRSMPERHLTRRPGAAIQPRRNAWLPVPSVHR